ncbi:MAG: uroporphyrinogen-III synthase [Rhizomicrobium sp.]
MRVLVTRPIRDGEKIARRLALLGHQALLAPLVSVKFLNPALDLKDVQAVLATSANGVRAFCALTRRRDLPLFAVGPQTAAQARDEGFIHVSSAEGDAGALARAVNASVRPEAGPLLHAAGEEAGRELGDSLRRHGFRVVQKHLYRMEAAQRFPDDAAQAMCEAAIDAAMFFSPRSAALFAHCALKEQLPTAGILAVCISATTAVALEGLALSAIRIAREPNQDALLACL